MHGILVNRIADDGSVTKEIGLFLESGEFVTLSIRLFLRIMDTITKIINFLKGVTS